MKSSLIEESILELQVLKSIMSHWDTPLYKQHYSQKHEGSKEYAKNEKWMPK
jgi:hypothetical protein